MQTVLFGEHADGKRDIKIFDEIFSFDEGRSVTKNKHRPY